MARQGYRDRECIIYGISGLNKVLDKLRQEHMVWMQMEFYGFDAESATVIKPSVMGTCTLVSSGCSDKGARFICQMLARRSVRQIDGLCRAEEGKYRRMPENTILGLLIL